MKNLIIVTLITVSVLMVTGKGVSANSHNLTAQGMSENTDTCNCCQNTSNT
jgi:hypothetical protein